MYMYHTDGGSRTRYTLVEGQMTLPFVLARLLAYLLSQRAHLVRESNPPPLAENETS